MDESYLDSNFAPLHHFTTVYTLAEIFSANTLNVGYYQNPYKDKKDYFVSLTRNKNLDLKQRECNVRIDLDRNKLKNYYNIIPYDYFIHDKQEIYPKSNIKRIKEFEFEEIILNNITNLNKYILNIDLTKDMYDIYVRRRDILDYLNKYNISLSVRDKKIDIKTI